MSDLLKLKLGEVVRGATPELEGHHSDLSLCVEEFIQGAQGLLVRSDRESCHFCLTLDPAVSCRDSVAMPQLKQRRLEVFLGKVHELNGVSSWGEDKIGRRAKVSSLGKYCTSMLQDTLVVVTTDDSDAIVAEDEAVEVVRNCDRVDLIPDARDESLFLFLQVPLN